MQWRTLIRCRTLMYINYKQNELQIYILEIYILIYKYLEIYNFNNVKNYRRPFDVYCILFNLQRSGTSTFYWTFYYHRNFTYLENIVVAWVLFWYVLIWFISFILTNRLNKDIHLRHIHIVPTLLLTPLLRYSVELYLVVIFNL